MFKKSISLKEKRSSFSWLFTIFIFNVCVFSSQIVLKAQTYSPRSYWTFDNTSNSFKDSMNLFNMDPNYYQSGYVINNNVANTGARSAEVIQ